MAKSHNLPKQESNARTSRNRRALFFFFFLTYPTGCASAVVTSQPEIVFIEQDYYIEGKEKCSYY